MESASLCGTRSQSHDRRYPVAVEAASSGYIERPTRKERSVKPPGPPGGQTPNLWRHHTSGRRAVGTDTCSSSHGQHVRQERAHCCLSPMGSYLLGGRILSHAHRVAAGGSRLRSQLASAARNFALRQELAGYASGVSPSFEGGLKRMPRDRTERHRSQGGILAVCPRS